MQANVDKFKHFDIDAAGQERLIEMWKYFNPKDEPVPATRHSIYLNDKFPDMSNHSFMEILKYQVFGDSCHKIDRWQCRTQNILTAEPIELLYQTFIDLKSDREPKPRKAETDAVDGDKPSRKKK